MKRPLKQCRQMDQVEQDWHRIQLAAFAEFMALHPTVETHKLIAMLAANFATTLKAIEGLAEVPEKSQWSYRNKCISMVKRMLLDTP